MHGVPCRPEAIALLRKSAEREPGTRRFLRSASGNRNEKSTFAVIHFAFKILTAPMAEPGQRTQVPTSIAIPGASNLPCKSVLPLQ